MFSDKVAGWGSDAVMEGKERENLFHITGPEIEAWRTELLVNENVYKYTGQEKEEEPFTMMKRKDVEDIRTECNAGTKNCALHFKDSYNRCGSGKSVGVESCRYDVAVLQEPDIAKETKTHINTFRNEQIEANKHCT